MGIFDNYFVKKAVSSMLSKEQMQTMEVMVNAMDNGEIDRDLLKKAEAKMSKFTPDDVNRMLALIVENF